MSRVGALLILLTIALSANAGDAEFKKGEKAYHNGQFAEAFKYINAHLETNPTSREALHIRGNIYFLKQDFDRAFKDFDKAIKAHPRDAMSYRNRGAAYMSKKLYDEAISDFNEAIGLDQESDFIYYHDRATAYRLIGQYNQAIADLKKVIKRFPNDHMAHNDLAFLYAACPEQAIRDGKKALELSKKAREQNDEVYFYLFTLAAAHAEVGEFDDALKWQKKDLRLSKPALKNWT